MSNMSYCRFQNTSKYLRDCQNALARMAAHRAEKLSSDELDAAKDLVRTCIEIVGALAKDAGLGNVGTTEQNLLAVENMFEEVLDHLNTVTKR